MRGCWNLARRQTPPDRLRDLNRLSRPHPRPAENPRALPQGLGFVWRELLGTVGFIRGNAPTSHRLRLPSERRLPRKGQHIVIVDVRFGVSWVAIGACSRGFDFKCADDETRDMPAPLIPGSNGFVSREDFVGLASFGKTRGDGEARSRMSRSATSWIPRSARVFTGSFRHDEDSSESCSICARLVNEPPPRDLWMCAC